MVACAGPASISPAYPSDPEAITVSAGENFYGDLLHQLGGMKLRIYAFLSNPNADPHQYESSAATAQVVADSRLVIENGLGYDTFIDKLLGASPNPKRIVINVQKVIGASNGSNPHVWYDPTVMPKVAVAAAAALASADPANATTYESNLKSYVASLQLIQSRVAEMKQRLQGTPVAFTEPVFEYMAGALGLDIRSPEAFMRAVEEGNEPAPNQVAVEEDLITRHQVKVLIYNSQTITKITSQIRDLANRSGVPVLGVSETEPPGKTYQQWQLDTLASLDGALGLSA